MFLDVSWRWIRTQLLGLSLRSFHQEGIVNVKVCESDFVALWDEQ